MSVSPKQKMGLLDFGNYVFTPVMGNFVETVLFGTSNKQFSPPVPILSLHIFAKMHNVHLYLCLFCFMKK